MGPGHCPTLKQVQDILNPTRVASAHQISSQQKAYALEVLDIILTTEHKRLLLPLIDDLSPAQRWQRLNALYPQPNLSRKQYLQTIIEGSPEWFSSWIIVCAVYVIDHLQLTALTEAVAAALESSEAVVRETAVWTLARLDQARFCQQILKLADDSSPQVVKAVEYETNPTVKRINLRLILPRKKENFLRGVG